MTKCLPISTDFWVKCKAQIGSPFFQNMFLFLCIIYILTNINVYNLMYSIGQFRCYPVTWPRSTCFLSRRVRTRLAKHETRPPASGGSLPPWELVIQNVKRLSNEYSEMAWNGNVQWNLGCVPDLTHKPSVSACSETCKIALSRCKVPWQVIWFSNCLAMNLLEGQHPTTMANSPTKMISKELIHPCFDGLLYYIGYIAVGCSR